MAVIPTLGHVELVSGLAVVQRGSHHPGCWLAAHGRYERGEMPPCDGAMTKAHLIPKRLLRRFLPPGDLYLHGSWVWACGGPTGAGGHHAMLDTARTIRVPRVEIPESTEQLAVRLKLEWFLDKEYGS